MQEQGDRWGKTSSGTVMELGAPDTSHTERILRWLQWVEGGNTWEPSNPSLCTYTTNVSGHVSGWLFRNCIFFLSCCTRRPSWVFSKNSCLIRTLPKLAEEKVLMEGGVMGWQLTIALESRVQDTNIGDETFLQRRTKQGWFLGGQRYTDPRIQRFNHYKSPGPPTFSLFLFLFCPFHFFPRSTSHSGNSYKHRQWASQGGPQTHFPRGLGSGCAHPLQTAISAQLSSQSRGFGPEQG